MRKATNKARGIGRATAKAGRISGRAAAHSKPEWLLNRKSQTLSNPQVCDSVVGWLAQSASTSSSAQSTLSSRQSVETNPHPGPPSSAPAYYQRKSDLTVGHSEELFSGPFPHADLASSPSQHVAEEILCTDAQTLESADVEDENGEERPLVSQELDDDETQLTTTDLDIHIQRTPEDQSEEVEDEVMGGTDDDDDEVNDPTYVRDIQSEDSSAEGDASSAPRQVGRGNMNRRGRGVAEICRPQSFTHTTQTSKVPIARARVSAVWKFFQDSAEDKRVVICNLCSAKLSRGQTTSSLTTTSMRRHMAAKHPTLWSERAGSQSLSARQLAASSHMPRASATREQGARTHASQPVPVHTSSQASIGSTSTVSQCSVQQSIGDCFARKRHYSGSHPQAQTLNAHISQLLSLEMLPFRLVESRSFRRLMAAAQPRYSVPSRHYFSRCAVPALHIHVSKKVSRALINSVTGNVHLTTDTWTSAGGQGRYISLTAHWVNVVEAGTEGTPGTARVLPTPRISGPNSVMVSPASFATSSTPRSSSASSSYSSNALSCPSKSVASWKSCSTALGKRQQALLKLICLGDKPHNAAELLTGITQQTDLWLAPLNLKPGMVVCDNGRNLVAALDLGKLTHVPCLAHVLNLVVQRFLKTYPALPELLVKVRRVCAHFRKSHPASSALAVLQQRSNLPAHRLICDVTTRWNSTFHMLDRLCEQRSSVVEYELQSSRHMSSQLPHITRYEWSWMSDLCEVLRNFEECTKMVSGDDAIISVTIPLLCLLKQSLLTIKEEALHVNTGEAEEDFTLPDRQPNLWSSQRTSDSIEDEEEEDEEEDGGSGMGDFTQSGITDPGIIPSVRRGWEDDEERENEVHIPLESEDRELMTVGSLAHMADFMFCCLCSDPRVIRILDNNEYWLFTLLDPRYRESFASLIPAAERSSKMLMYQKALRDKLLLKFPCAYVGGRATRSAVDQEGRRQPQSGSQKGRGKMATVWNSFIHPTQEADQQVQGTESRREKFARMVNEYLSDRTKVLTVSSAPHNYWVSKLDTWHELSLYALEVLACPAASVLSERVFSAAGGIITDKRMRLSTENADRLTFIKMNEAWIGADYCSPVVNSSRT